MGFVCRIRIQGQVVEAFSDRIRIGLESSISYKFDFDSLAQAVPIWNCGSGVPFVLVIDEASGLKKLAQSDYSVR